MRTCGGGWRGNGKRCRDGVGEMGENVGERGGGGKEIRRSGRKKEGVGRREKEEEE